PCARRRTPRKRLTRPSGFSGRRRCLSPCRRRYPSRPGYSWTGTNRSELVDLAGERARRGFTEHIIIVPAADSPRIAAQAAEALPNLRRAQHLTPPARRTGPVCESFHVPLGFARRGLLSPLRGSFATSKMGSSSSAYVVES